jgi:hypothetical protein
MPCLSPAFTVVSCLAYSWTLKIESICSAKKSVDFQRTTRRYNPEDRNFRRNVFSELGLISELVVVELSEKYLY